ncbi:type II toxin-antitoxin system PemK/MazF family toxin [Limosilactobacillus reuteri]|uniref:type II toxin-antitoxin system PemK/MazF family toxin n=1 Tax=Limosilactobacillus reuteri TaxID=1598 RepID=UPI001E4C661F|nr:type II toxin-antitoxin system PemK/MazF family toxin [Limosilactobacillus reuteri]MCC4380500.1 type II toxin-antitoxin system PemK/MazF family toxin [Limosilactobacillus reuteri]
MSTNNFQYTEEQKRQKISKFNNVYYEGDPSNWKVSRLPNWMQSYGYLLDKELQNNLPSYYRRFRQGTVVMIDYGITIGNELGGKHFGVVLNNDDTKHKRKVTVVPLSSHWHKGYIDLGYDLMSGINDLIELRKDEEQKKINKLIKRLNEFSNNHKDSHFSFSDEEIKFINDNGVKNFPKDNSTVELDFSENNDKLESLIEDIKQVDSWEQHKNIFDFVSLVETALSFQKSVNTSLKELRDNLFQMKQLEKKLTRYNKQSYAVISDIKSVSKLRVAKLNHFTISGNARISAKNLDKIRQGFIKTIE